MGRRLKLTPELTEEICKYIKMGAFDYVAAQSVGIESSTFRRWMLAGEKGQEPYKAFYTEVRGARAYARTIAENAVFNDNPLAWLRFGPGRDRPGEPGWTDAAKVEVSGADGAPVRAEVTHKIDADAAVSIFDILARAGALEAITGDAAPDEVHPV